MSRARLTFPIEELVSCVTDGEWRKCEDILPVLRQFAMKSGVAELDTQAEHADLVAAFLLGVQERRRPLRARVVETAKAFARSKDWERVLQCSPLLLEAPKPPEPMASQAEVLEAVALAEAPQAESLTTSLPVTPPPQASSLAPESLGAFTLQDAPNPFDEVSPPLSPSAPMQLLPPSVEEQLRKAVQAVLAIDTPTKFENWSVSVFAKLRKAVLHAAQLPWIEMIEMLDGESGLAAAVLTYLLDISKDSPIRNHQVCEVVWILLQCPSWQKAARESPSLLEHIAHPDTPREVQARFASAVGHASSKALPKWKKVSRWFLGCGQKSGQGVSSPCHGRRPAAGPAVGGA